MRCLISGKAATADGKGGFSVEAIQVDLPGGHEWPYWIEQLRDTLRLINRNV